MKYYNFKISLLSEKMHDLAAFSSLFFIIGFISGPIFKTHEPLNVHIVKRYEWKAQTTAPLKPDSRPAFWVIISHTDTEPCFDQAKCKLIVRMIQTYHIESRGYDDIAYNFLIGGDGLVYEGRGWNARGSGTYYNGFNLRTIGIAFIGTFHQSEPTKAQLRAAQRLLERGVQTDNIMNDYELYGLRQWVKKITKNPGEVLYEIIQTWAHWLEKPDI